MLLTQQLWKGINEKNVEVIAPTKCLNNLTKLNDNKCKLISFVTNEAKITLEEK